jgi:hypothetical protein
MNGETNYELQQLAREHYQRKEAIAAFLKARAELKGAERFLAEPATPSAFAPLQKS